VQPQYPSVHRPAPGAVWTAPAVVARALRLLAAALLLGTVLLVVALVNQSVAALRVPASRADTPAVPPAAAAAATSRIGGQGAADLPHAVTPVELDARAAAVAQYARAFHQALTVLPSADPRVGAGQAAAASGTQSTPATGGDRPTPVPGVAPSYQSWWPGPRSDREQRRVQLDREEPGRDSEGSGTPFRDGRVAAAVADGAVVSDALAPQPPTGHGVLRSGRSSQASQRLGEIEGLRQERAALYRQLVDAVQQAQDPRLGELQTQVDEHERKIREFYGVGSAEDNEELAALGDKLDVLSQQLEDARRQSSDPRLRQIQGELDENLQRVSELPEDLDPEQMQELGRLQGQYGALQRQLEDTQKQSPDPHVQGIQAQLDENSRRVGQLNKAGAARILELADRREVLDRQLQDARRQSPDSRVRGIQEQIDVLKGRIDEKLGGLYEGMALPDGSPVTIPVLGEGLTPSSPGRHQEVVVSAAPQLPAGDPDPRTHDTGQEEFRRFRLYEQLEDAVQRSEDPRLRQLRAEYEQNEASIGAFWESTSVEGNPERAALSQESDALQQQLVAARRQSQDLQVRQLQGQVDEVSGRFDGLAEAVDAEGMMERSRLAEQLSSLYRQLKAAQASSQDPLVREVLEQFAVNERRVRELNQAGVTRMQELSARRDAFYQQFQQAQRESSDPLVRETQAQIDQLEQLEATPQPSASYRDPRTHFTDEELQQFREIEALQEQRGPLSLWLMDAVQRSKDPRLRQLRAEYEQNEASIGAFWESTSVESNPERAALSQESDALQQQLVAARRQSQDLQVRQLQEQVDEVSGRFDELAEAVEPQRTLERSRLAEQLSSLQRQLKDAQAKSQDPQVREVLEQFAVNERRVRDLNQAGAARMQELSARRHELQQQFEDAQRESSDPLVRETQAQIDQTEQRIKELASSGLYERTAPREVDPALGEDPAPADPRQPQGEEALPDHPRTVPDQLPLGPDRQPPTAPPGQPKQDEQGSVAPSQPPTHAAVATPSGSPQTDGEIGGERSATTQAPAPAQVLDAERVVVVEQPPASEAPVTPVEVARADVQDEEFEMGDSAAVNIFDNSTLSSDAGFDGGGFWS
jgi:hypothetical protein